MWQDSQRPVYSPSFARATGRNFERKNSIFRPEHSISQCKRSARPPRPLYFNDLSRSYDISQPSLVDWRANGRNAPSPYDYDPARSPKKVSRPIKSCGTPLTKRKTKILPPSTQRRNAATCHDCNVPGLRSQSSDCR